MPPPPGGASTVPNNMTKAQVQVMPSNKTPLTTSSAPVTGPSLQSKNNGNTNILHSNTNNSGQQNATCDLNRPPKDSNESKDKGNLSTGINQGTSKKISFATDSPVGTSSNSDGHGKSICIKMIILFRKYKHICRQSTIVSLLLTGSLTGAVGSIMSSPCVPSPNPQASSARSSISSASPKPHGNTLTVAPNGNKAGSGHRQC